MAQQTLVIEGPAGSISAVVSDPPRAFDRGRTLFICHGLPLSRDGASTASRLLPELAERVAQEAGWRAVAVSFRGIGDSQGSFSASGWLEDLNAVLDAELGDRRGYSIAGFGFGGAIALRQAANDERARGVVALATPSKLQKWCGDATNFLNACKHAGVIGGDDKVDAEALRDDVIALDPCGAIATIPPRRILVIHGSVDTTVPESSARDLVDAAQGHAELRIIQGAGHWLRADPRMVATLLGWLDR